MSIAIVHARQQSTPGSHWTEHLCLRHLEHGLYELSLRTFEVLGEHGDYTNDDGELPETINGKTVVAVEDGYICGGELIFVNDDEEDVARFRDESSPAVTEWLESNGWLADQVLPLLRSAMWGISAGEKRR